MRCPECDRHLSLDAVACACGWQSPTLVVATDWLDQPCSMPGCTVVIRSRAGSQSPIAPICKWCEQDTAHYRSAESRPHPHIGPVMTREEFGLDLSAAIRLHASASMARQNADRLRALGYVEAAEEAEQSASHDERQLGRVLDAGNVTPGDLRRLLEISAQPLRERVG